MIGSAKFGFFAKMRFFFRQKNEKSVFFCFVVWQKHLVVAAQGATHLPRVGAQVARMNSHASDLVAEGRQACTDVPRKARCPRGHHVHAARYEVPRDAIPQTRSPAPRPVDRRPRAVDTPRSVDTSSCTIRQWTGLSKPQRGLAPVVRQARTTLGWHTQEQFSPPKLS